MKKFFAILSFFMAAAGTVSGYERNFDWSSFKAILPKSPPNCIQIMDGRTWIARIYANAGDINLVKVTGTPGKLNIDTTGYYGKFPKGRLVMHAFLFGAPIESGRTARLEVTMAASTPNAGVAFQINGQTRPDATLKQFWNQPVDFTLGTETNTYSTTKAIPKGLKSLHVLFYLPDATVYTLEKIALDYPGPTAAASTGAPAAGTAPDAIRTDAGASVTFNFRDFNSVVADNSLKLYDGRRPVGVVFARKGGRIADISARIEAGALVIDTTACYAATPEAEVIMHLYGFPRSAVVTGREARLAAEIKAGKSGTPVAFNLTGTFSRDAKVEKRQYWNKPREFMLLDQYQTFAVSNLLPDGLAVVQSLFYLPAGAVYSIRSLSLSYPEAPKTEVDASRNLIINGGAERGFYLTSRNTMAIMASPVTGKHHSKFGVMSRASEVTLDPEIRRSGKYSFKIRSYEACLFDRLSFSPVTFIPGRPLTFSIWLKADRPVKGQLWFAVASGQRYQKHISIGTEWKKYVITVNRFGPDTAGRSGAPGTWAPEFNCTFPTLLVMGDATVWADDARCQYATDTTDAGETLPVRVSGEFDRANRYYHAGETPVFNLEIDSDHPASGTVGWVIRDYFGREIVAAAPETWTFPLKKALPIRLPDQVRGPLHLELTVTPMNGQPIVHGGLFGVIDRARELDKRIGINAVYGGFYNTDEMIRMMKDFGIGAVRLWREEMTAGELDEAGRYHDAGIFVLYSFARAATGARERYFLPKDPAPFLSELRNWITGVTRGKVDVYDLLNEPNAWTGRNNPDAATLVPPTIENVVELEKQMAAVIHAADPGVPISAPSTCNTQPEWIDRFLALGGSEFTDLISEHPYRRYAEMPDYLTDLNKIRRFSDKYNRKFRIISTERGIRYPSYTPDHRITPALVGNVNNLVRLLITAIAGGSEQFYSFISGYANASCDFSDLMLSDAASGSVWVPGFYWFAARNFSERLLNAVYHSEVKLGFELRCYVFQQPDGSSTAVIWKWHGQPAAIELGETIESYDMMGSRFDGRSFMLDDAPRYLVSGRNPAELAALIRQAKIAVVGHVIDVKPVMLDQRHFALKLTNLSPQPLSGELRVLSDDVAGGKTAAFSGIEPMGEQLFKFELRRTIGLDKHQLKGEVRLDNGRTMPFEADLSGLVVPETPAPITIDGDLSDWPANAATFSLDSRHAATDRERWEQTPDEKKIRAEVKAAWDPDHLYLAVVVSKPEFCPNPDSNPEDMWLGDSLQIAFDPLINANLPKVGYNDDDFEYCVSQCRGRTTVWRSCASDASYDSLVKPTGVIDEVPLAIRGTPGRTVYEMAFPTFAVSPFKLLPGSAMRFNLIVNVNDGKVRRGWLQLAPGIGQMPKSPFEFVNLVLVK